MVTQTAVAQAESSGVLELDCLLELIKDRDGVGVEGQVALLRWRLASNNLNPGRWVGWKDAQLFGQVLVGGLYHAISILYDREGRLARKALKGGGGLEFEVTIGSGQIIVISTDDEIEAVFKESLKPGRDGSALRRAPNPPSGLLMAMRHRS